jgi:hypothetical protein
MPERHLGAVLLYFVIAVLIATALGSVVQTQFNATAIADLGFSVSFRDRIAMTLHDLGSFTPIYGLMVGVTLLFALPVAVLATRWIGGYALWFLAAGAIGILVAFLIANALLPMPTFIAATRGVGGILAMMFSAAVGAWAFGAMLARRRHDAHA